MLYLVLYFTNDAETFFFNKETLEKMRERIEISSNNYDGSDVLIHQRMEELKHND